MDVIFLKFFILFYFIFLRICLINLFALNGSGACIKFMDVKVTGIANNGWLMRAT